MNTFENVLNEERNVTLTMYLNLDSSEFGFTKRPLIVVIPGGGYSMCSDRESEIVALQYMAAGFQACVLRYTLRDKGGWPYPLEDYDQAIEFISLYAGEWNIDMDHVATVGFSAGGHLAACTATLARHKPRAAICVYPAILPDIVDACQPGMPRPHEHVDGDTSPCFLVSARDDTVVKVNNTLVFAQVLENAGISFEMHVYASGQHGFSVGTPLVLTVPATPRAACWVSDSISWLGEIMGALTAKGFTEPTLAPRMNTDSDPFLSVRCSLAHIRKQPESVQPLMEPLYTFIRNFCQEQGYDFEVFCTIIGSETVQNLLQKFQAPPEQVRKLNKALTAIPSLM